MEGMVPCAFQCSKHNVSPLTGSIVCTDTCGLVFDPESRRNGLGFAYLKGIVSATAGRGRRPSIYKSGAPLIKKTAFARGLCKYLTALSSCRYCFGGVLAGVFGAGVAGLLDGAVVGLTGLVGVLPAAGAGTPDCTL